VLGYSGSPSRGNLPAELTCSAGLRLRESAKATGGLNNGRVFTALKEPRTRVPSSDFEQEMAYGGRRLLESVAAEVARQTKSRALAVAAPPWVSRQFRG